MALGATMIKSSKGIFDGRVGWRKIPLCASVSYHLPRLPCGNVERLAPILHAQSRPLDCDPVICGSIPRLNLCRRPAAVGFFVVPVVVDSVDRISLGRAWTHILIEILKRLPSFAYFYAASAVSMVFMMVGAFASSPHLRPDTPFRSMAHPVKIGTSKTVSLDHLRAVLAGQAAAAKFRISKVGCSSDRRISAVAFT